VWKNNTVVGDIALYVEDKGGHHSVFGHIPVEKEKYYIIRIKKGIFGNRLLHLYTELPALGRKIDICKHIQIFACLW
jgi:hypothetical protein